MCLCVGVVFVWVCIFVCECVSVCAVLAHLAIEGCDGKPCNLFVSSGAYCATTFHCKPLNFDIILTLIYLMMSKAWPQRALYWEIYSRRTQHCVLHLHQVDNRFLINNICVCTTYVKNVITIHKTETHTHKHTNTQTHKHTNTQTQTRARSLSLSLSLS